MKKKHERKLTLSRETLRSLASRELEKARGGMPDDYTDEFTCERTCDSCGCPPPQ
jgi:hypothetical protein